jgi:uncharacterized protein Yka (UPF0111/DUF47 family)
LHWAVTQIYKAVTELRNMKNMRQITDALVAINSIENQGDDIFDMSIERLICYRTRCQGSY